jgi:hypothetical protein
MNNKKIIDRTGEKIGKWNILETVIVDSGYRRQTMYKGQCECGEIQLIYPSNLNKFKTSQCKRCYINGYTVDIIGQSFGHLKVLKFISQDKRYDKWYECLCSCGNITKCSGSSLRSERRKRCQKCKIQIHQKQLQTHKMKGTSTYNIWMGIKARCLNPCNKAYKNYGGRGIKLDPRWHKFAYFFEDMGARPEGMQIDRINNDGPYTKDNCRWTTAKINSNNRRKNASRDTNKIE